MILALAGAGFLLGLAGGPHCVAMCGPLCGSVVRFARPGRALAVVEGQFHLGRVVGYALAGGAAAQAVDSLAWMSSHSAALRPFWILVHVAALAWGMALLLLGRQPRVAAVAAAGLARRLRGNKPIAGGVFAAGLLWVAMPCSLLYSALLAAALSGGAASGALSMAAFAAGGAISLAAAPRVLEYLPVGARRLGADFGTRIAGALIVLASAWALAMDMSPQFALWCGTL